MPLWTSHGGLNRLSIDSKKFGDHDVYGKGSDMIQCPQCGRNLDGEAREGRVVSISGSVMGDETTESYYFCSHCHVYMIEVYRERFLGEDEVSIRGPVAKSEGDGMVELIRKCSEPWNKKCRCDVHRSYFKGWLD